MTDGQGQFTLLPSTRDAALTRQVHVRWDVKTGGGPDVNLIDAGSATQTTIVALRSQQAPAAWPPPGRVQPVETTIWEFDATLAGYKFEQDQDYHLVLSDANGNTMIAEIPDPSVVDASSRFLPQITSGRQAFDARFGRQLQAPCGTSAARGVRPDDRAPVLSGPRDRDRVL